MQSLNLEEPGSICDLPWATGFRRSRRLGAWLGKLAAGNPDLETSLVTPFFRAFLSCLSASAIEEGLPNAEI
jgi:hypothetical protein